MTYAEGYALGEVARQFSRLSRRQLEKAVFQLRANRLPQLRPALNDARVKTANEYLIAHMQARQKFYALLRHRDKPGFLAGYHGLRERRAA